MLPELSSLFERDLTKVIGEIEAYPSEDALWRVGGDIANPAGTLALHLAGNLRQFVGEDLGGVAYERDRPAEFSRRGVPRAELLAGLRRTLEVVRSTLEHLDPARLDRLHPRQPPGFPKGMTSRYFLIHLYGHLNYHLGQINYHRRLLAGQD